MPTSHNHSNQSSHHSYHQSPHRNQEPVSQGNQHSTPVQQQQQQQQAGQPVEFNHAINYVNKIKVKICHRHGDAQQQAGQPVKFNHVINYVNKIKVKIVIVMVKHTYADFTLTHLPKAGTNKTGFRNYERIWLNK